MNKKILVILFAIPIASSTISWYVFNLNADKQADTSLAKTNSHKKIADTYFNQAEIISFDETGTPKSKVIGARINHYPGDKDSEISTPQVTLIRESGSPIYITADQGWVNKDASRVTLQGNTIIKRKKSPANESFRLETPELIIWPNKNIAETDKAIRISSDTTITTGVGMKAYLEDEHYYLFNNVKIYHLPIKEAADNQ